METLQQPKEVKARKKHQCDFCFERISEGENYIKSTHVHDGEVYDWKTHKHCSKLASDLKMYEDCDEGVTGDYFQEIVADKYYSIMVSKFEGDDRNKYSEEIGHFRYVSFRHKLGTVIRCLKVVNQLDK